MTVYGISGVDPEPAIVLFAGDREVLNVWTREGRSPALIPGLCEYYLDHAYWLCAAQPSS